MKIPHIKIKDPKLKKILENCFPHFFKRWRGRTSIKKSSRRANKC